MKVEIDVSYNEVKVVPHRSSVVIDVEYFVNYILVEHTVEDVVRNDSTIISILESYLEFDFENADPTSFEYSDQLFELINEVKLELIKRIDEDEDSY